MVSKFQQHIVRHKLCNKSDKILVAVSGGVDSVVMLDLLVQNDYQPAIAHCNFHLRGKESDDDEAFVRELAEKYALPIYVKQCPATEYANNKHVSIEMAARDLRYAWFHTLIKNHHFQKLAIGHNRDDDAETFFINLFRHSGLHGLKGIPVERDQIIRPLLFASREEILAYAQQNKLSFREDSSNATDNYLRNRIRHHLLPFLETHFPGSRNALSGTIDKLKESDTLFEMLLAEKKQQLIETAGKGWRISKEKLNTYPQKSVLLFYLLHYFGFKRSQTEQIVRALNEAQSGQIYFSESYRLLLDREVMIIEPHSAHHDQVYPLEIRTIDYNTPLPLQLRLIQKDDHFKLEKARNKAYFDADKIFEPLYLRKWKKGDRFAPFGMRGSKLLSDYFIDEKFSRFEKENTWLLVSGDTILWIVGHRASRFYSIGHETKNVLEMTLKEK